MHFNKQFGNIEKHKDYYKREGVYGIIMNKDQKFGIIKATDRYFLPGGGTHGEESHKACLHREFLEETGYSIEIEQYLGQTDFHFHSKDFLHHYMHILSHYYTVTFKDYVKEPIECDHELVWLTYQECQDRMFLEHQRYGITYFYENLFVK
jgi:8-oxo-dGTP diphosphatase